MRVYIAGPIRQGDQFANVRAAIDAAEQVLQSGHFPFLPHLLAYWHTIHPHLAATWMAYDEAWLQECEALIRLPGPSEGSDQEVRWARLHNIPVYKSVKAFLKAVQ